MSEKSSEHAAEISKLLWRRRDFRGNQRKDQEKEAELQGKDKVLLVRLGRIQSVYGLKTNVYKWERNRQSIVLM